MLNIPLYKRGIKVSWKLLLVLAAVITMYFVIIIQMFDPALGVALHELQKAMPELMAMFGMDLAVDDMVYFLSSYLYGFIMLIFPMVFSILTANKLIARHVDRGSMAYLLAAPVRRVTVVRTQLAVLLSGVLALVVFSTILGIVASELSFPGELDIPSFILMNVGLFTLQLFISSICFLASVFFNDSRNAVGIGAGIPALAYVVKMLADAGEDIEAAKYFTFFSLYDAEGLIARDTFALWSMLILFVAAVALFVVAVEIFKRKDLHV